MQQSTRDTGQTCENVWLTCSHDWFILVFTDKVKLFSRVFRLFSSLTFRFLLFSPLSYET